MCTCRYDGVHVGMMVYMSGGVHVGWGTCRNDGLHVGMLVYMSV